MDGRERTEVGLALIGLVAGVLGCAVAVAGHRWWLVVGAGALVLGGAVQLRSALGGPARRRASRQAAAGWSAERVRSVTAGTDGEVQAVRAVRSADPALTLADAAAVVRSGRGGPGH